MQREEELRQSRKLVIALWPEQMAPNFGRGLPPACPDCSIQLKLRDNGYFCTGCGTTYPIESTPPTKVKKFKPKQSGAGGNLIIASQSRSGKKRKPKGLDALSSSDSDTELRKDLQALGVIASDVNEY